MLCLAAHVCRAAEQISRIADMGQGEPMPNLKLTLACWDYDRTRALFDGRVKPAGVDLDLWSTRNVGEIMDECCATANSTSLSLESPTICAALN